jgi:hypothetical protein
MGFPSFFLSNYTQRAHTHRQRRRRHINSSSFLPSFSCLFPNEKATTRKKRKKPVSAGGVEEEYL